MLRFPLKQCPTPDRVRSMSCNRSGQSVVSLLLLAGVVGSSLFSGCGDTSNDRRQISQHTKDLAAMVKADPKSEQGQTAMKELIKTLNGNWVFAQCRAADALGSLGPLAEPALSDLMESTNSKNGFVEDAAVHALATLGPTAAPAVDILISKLEYAVTHTDYSVFTTLDSIRGLGNIGKPALKAIPILERATQLENELAVKDAQESLDKLKRLQVSETQDKQSAKE